MGNAGHQPSDRLDDRQSLCGRTVLVTGASGYTGAVLTKKLVACGAKVRAIARSSSDLSQFDGLSIDWIRGNVFDEATIDRAIVGIEYVFHVAAAYREPNISDDTYVRVHIDSTKLLAHKLLDSSTLKRFVHISTVGVHGHIEDPPADEEYRFSPGDIYQSTKAEAELWIRGFAAQHAFPLAVIRPVAIYGPGDKRLLKVFKMAAKPLFPLFGSGRCLYHLIHVEDLTDIFIRAAIHPAAVGKVFIAGNPAPTGLKDIASCIASELGNSQLKFIRLPAWPLFLAAQLCEAICNPLHIAPPLYRRRVAFFTKDRSFTTQKLTDVLNFKHAIPVDVGLRETARWYRDKGWM
jgi:dihydroflavonol-4-reductase